MPISPLTTPFTLTFARLTRCTTARIVSSLDYSRLSPDLWKAPSVRRTFDPANAKPLGFKGAILNRIRGFAGNMAFLYTYSPGPLHYTLAFFRNAVCGKELWGQSPIQ